MTKRNERGRPAGRPRFFAAAAALALLVLVAGCGGEDEDPTTSPDAKAEFIAEVDRLCTESGEESNAAVQERLQPEGKKPPVVDDNQVIEIYEDITIPSLEELFDRIGRLEPPPGDEDEIDAILAAADEALEQANEDPPILAKPPGQGNPFDETNALEQEYGFEVCGAVASSEAG